MTKKETVLYTLKDLIEKNFSQIIIEENKRHNDGIVLDNIMGVAIDSKNMPMPYIKLTVNKAEHTEKDRVLKLVKYNVDVEFILSSGKNTWVKTERYIEALGTFISNNVNKDFFYFYDVAEIIENKIILQIEV